MLLQTGRVPGRKRSGKLVSYHVQSGKKNHQRFFSEQIFQNRKRRLGPKLDLYGTSLVLPSGELAQAELTTSGRPKEKQKEPLQGMPWKNARIQRHNKSQTAPWAQYGFKVSRLCLAPATADQEIVCVMALWFQGGKKPAMTTLKPFWVVQIPPNVT